MTDKELSKKLTELAMSAFEKVAEEQGFTIKEHFRPFAQGFIKGLISGMKYEEDIKERVERRETEND